MSDWDALPKRKRIKNGFDQGNCTGVNSGMHLEHDEIGEAIRLRSLKQLAENDLNAKDGCSGEYFECKFI